MSFIIDTMVQTNFKKIVAGKERILPEIHLVKTSGSKSWSISALEIKRTSRIVAQQIIESSEDITFEELEFLKNLYSVSYLGLSRILDIDEKTIMSRRKQDGTYDNLKSWKIRKYFSGIISYDIDSQKSNDKLKNKKFKLVKGKATFFRVSLISSMIMFFIYLVFSMIINFA